MSSVTTRIATVNDAQDLLKIYEYYVKNTAITFEYDVPSVDEFVTRINNTLKRYPYIVAELDGEIVGYVYASPFKERAAYDWAVETTVYVKFGLTKHGIGKTLYSALEEALKKQNITNLYACIAYPSEPDEYLDKNSAEYHTAIGYRLVGEYIKCGYKFDRWYNMVWMEKMIGEHRKNQPTFIPFCEL